MRPPKRGHMQTEDCHLLVLFEQSSSLNLQRFGDFFKNDDGWIAYTALDPGNVGAMEPGAICQFLLADTKLFSSSPQICAHAPGNVHRPK